jgi:fatty-acyl-CoA synthase
MTSGTTGTPKGAQRRRITPPPGVVISALSQVPVHVGEAVVVAPPLFHALGFGFFGLSLMLQGTLVVQRTFDPEAVLGAVSRHRATTLVVVPVMLRRILDLPEATRRRHDTSSLRVILCSGSSLSADLAESAMEEFGDILFNFYGSTEVGWVAMARPSDLRAAPGTVGRIPMGIRVAILDAGGGRVATGESGRIFVGSGMAFEGYTGGGGKEEVDGLVSTGDMGSIDAQGRLFVYGRDDAMIVSGGENVFPEEVEDLLRGHLDVADAAVIGVDDAQMGQRLAAYVVPVPGSSLAEADVKDYVRSRLARFKVPRDVVFLDQVPRNATGKVLRHQLRPSHDRGSERTGS